MADDTLINVYFTSVHQTVPPLRPTLELQDILDQEEEVVRCEAIVTGLQEMIDSAFTELGRSGNWEPNPTPPPEPAFSLTPSPSSPSSPSSNLLDKSDKTQGERIDELDEQEDGNQGTGKTRSSQVANSNSGIARGGKYYRKAPAGPSGKPRYYYEEKSYHNRPDAHVSGHAAQQSYIERRIKRAEPGLESTLLGLLLVKGRAGVHLRDIGPLTTQYGAAQVGLTLRKIGVDFHGDRLFLRQKVANAPKVPNAPSEANAPNALSEGFRANEGSRNVSSGPENSDPLAKADMAPPSFGTGSYNPGAAARRLPIGSRRLWNSKIVEKKQDNKWHVIGSASKGVPKGSTEEVNEPGPKKKHDAPSATSAVGNMPNGLQSIGTHDFSREELAHLIKQLLAIHKVARDSKHR